MQSIGIFLKGIHMRKSGNFFLSNVWIRLFFWVLVLFSSWAVNISMVCMANELFDISEHHSMQTHQEIAFVDSGAEDWEFFRDGLSAHMPVHIIVPNEGGLVQMADILKEYKAFDAIHIFSHGSPGQVRLGATLLNRDKLERHAQVLASIGDHLKDDGDILLYGCRVGKGYAGRKFINILGQLTAADIAASDDLTGSTHLDGDWVLEKTVGDIAPERYQRNDILSQYPFVLAFPNTISFPTDPFSGGTRTTPYTVPTTDLGDITFKATDDGLATANASLSWMTGGGLMHASIFANGANGLTIFEGGSYEHGIWFVFAIV
jgi:hypothetical protein